MYVDSFERGYANSTLLKQQVRLMIQETAVVFGKLFFKVVTAQETIINTKVMSIYNTN